MFHDKVCPFSSLRPAGSSLGSSAGAQRAARQQEEQPGQDLQGNAGGGRHEGEAVVYGDLGVRTLSPRLLQDVAAHVHRLHPEHDEQQQEQEQAGCREREEETERNRNGDNRRRQRLRRNAQRCLPPAVVMETTKAERHLLLLVFGYVSLSFLFFYVT